MVQHCSPRAELCWNRINKMLGLEGTCPKYLQTPWLGPQLPWCQEVFPLKPLHCQELGCEQDIRRTISASTVPFKAWSLTGLTAVMFMPRLTTGFSQNFKDAHEQLWHLWGMVGSIYNTHDFKTDCFHGSKCGEREIGPRSFLDPSREKPKKYWNIGIEEFIFKML